MYKRAFQSKNWSALHAHLPSFLEKKKSLPKAKRAEAQKFKQYLKAAKKQVKQLQKDKVKAAKQTSETPPLEFVICPICSHECIPELFRYHVERRHRKSLSEPWMKDF